MPAASSSELWAWRQIQMHTGFDIELMPYTLVYARRCEAQAFLRGYQQGQQDTRRELQAAAERRHVSKGSDTPRIDAPVLEAEPLRKRLRTKQAVTK